MDFYIRSEIENMESLLSIIVPVYNVEKYLGRCIDSIINQTYRNLQIILVDDGSTDRSGDICEDYAKKDRRIRVVHKKNGGQATARNIGLKLAKGSYIGFVDSDDYIKEDMYAKLSAKIKEHHAQIACCGRVDTFENFKTGGKVHFNCKSEQCFEQVDIIRQLLLYKLISFSVCDKLFKAEIFRNIRFPERRGAEDVPVVYEVLKRALRVVHIGSIEYFYCHRRGSTTGQKFHLRKIDYLLFVRDIYRDVTKCYPALRKEAEAMYVISAISMWRQVVQGGDRKYAPIQRRLKKLVEHYSLRILVNSYIPNDKLNEIAEIKELADKKKGLKSK